MADSAAAAEWMLALRQIAQEVQSNARDNARDLLVMDAAELTREHMPMARRLVKLLRTEVVGASAEDDEPLELLAHELWTIVARVLVNEKTKGAVVLAFGALLGAFLGGNAEQSTKHRTAVEAMLAPVRIALLSQLMDASKAENRSVRFKVCQVLRCALSALRDVIPREVLAPLREAVVTRARDKVAAIRVEAAQVLGHLQGTDGDRSDPATTELLRLIDNDPSKDVRQAAVRAVIVSKATYHHILVRARDVNEGVRCAAIDSIGKKARIEDIPIKDRVLLLDQGLHDRADEVKLATKTLIVQRWLPACGRCPATLLRALDIEQFGDTGSEVAQLIIRHQFESNPLDEVSPYNALETLANGNPLEPERILYWRQQCRFFQDTENDPERLAQLLPNVTDFAYIVTAACTAGPDMVFVAQQLLLLAQLLDYQDEIGRRNLLSCLRKLLQDLDIDSQLIQPLMELLARICACESENEYLQVVAELTADVYDPLEEDESSANDLSEEELDRASARFEELEQHLSTLDVDSDEYQVVQDEMLELESLLQDPKTLRWLRCLEIVSQLLKLTSLTLANPVISGMGRFILPAIETDVPAIREAGLECLGLFCLLDRQVAERHFVVFWRALNNHEEEREVKLCCIKAMFDLSLSFSELKPQVVVVKSDQESNEADSARETNLPSEELETESVFLSLAQLVKHEDLEIQSTVIEGFCKLFLTDRIRNVAVMAMMLEAYFSPRLQRVQSDKSQGYQSRSLQLLSVFLPAYVSASTPHCMQFEEAIVYMIRNMLEHVSELETTKIDGFDLVKCLRYAIYLLSHPERVLGDLKVDENQVTKITEQQCAHGNRIGINICIDILALQEVHDNSKVSTANVAISMQRLLLQVLALLDPCQSEARSHALFEALVGEICEKCVDGQKGIARWINGLRKKFSPATLANSDAHGDVAKADKRWASGGIQARMQILQSAAASLGKRSTRVTASRAGASRRRRVESESADSESSSSSDDDDDNSNRAESPAPAPRRVVAARRSKSTAMDRMQHQEIAMKIEFSDDDDEVQSVDEDSESEDEESEASDEDWE